MINIANIMECNNLSPSEAISILQDMLRHSIVATTGKNICRVDFSNHIISFIKSKHPLLTMGKDDMFQA